jgi:ABC-2 type transport system permease protein
LTFVSIWASEWFKAVTQRSSHWSMGLWLLISTVFTLPYAAYTSSRSDLIDPVLARSSTGAVAVDMVWQWTMTTGVVLVPLLGTLIVTSEYSSRSIVATLVAAPRRGSVLAAKAIAAAIYTALTCLVILVINLVAVAWLLGRQGLPFVFDADAFRQIAGGLGFMVCLSLIATGLGAALRSSAGAITTSIGLTYGLYMVLTMLPTSLTVVPTLQRFALMHAGAQAYSLDSNLSFTSFLGWGGIVLGWAAIALLAGYAVIRRRDA